MTEPSQKDNLMQEKEGDELSLKDLFGKLKENFLFLLSKWKTIVLISLIGGGLGLAYSLISKIKYEAQLTFVLDEGKGGGLLGSYSSIASQFGLDLGAGGSGIGSGIYNTDNIMEFLKSKLMIERVLLSTVNEDGKQMTMADYYIQKYKISANFKNHPEMEGFSFPLNTQPESLNRLQDSVMSRLYDRVLKGNIVAERPDKKLNFISLKATSTDETFSKLFAERLVNEATRFYIETKTARSQTTVNKLQIQADSILDQLNKTSYKSAESQDLNQNPVMKMATVNTEFINRDKMILQTTYEEVARSLEMAKINLTEETPVIQIVDVPRYPLKIVHVGKLMGFVLGAFIVGFLISGWLLVKRLL